MPAARRISLEDLRGEPRRQALAAIRMERIRRSTLAAMTWRDPSLRPVPWQRDLASECDALVDSALAGTGRRVTLAAPPRHGKTELVGRALPLRTVVASRDAPMPILYVTSSDDRAKEVSSRVRSAIERLHRESGDPALAPGRIWTTLEWETAGGHQWTAVGWSSATGGIGCRLLIMDDLIGTSQVYRSQAKRRAIRRVVQEDLLSRLMHGGSAIQMETRRGPDDTTAWLQREYGSVWDDRVWPCYDPAREGSPYLWPEVYGEAWRATMPHLTDSSTIWRALYQQEPVAEGGTLIAMDWLEATYPEPPEVVRQLADRVVIGADLTATGKTTGDPAAFVVIAYRGAYRDVLHVVERRCGYVEQRQILRDLCETWQPDAVVVELAAGGDAMVDELAGEIPGLRGERAVADKVARLTPHLSRFAARQVRTPEQGARWVGPWREEHSAFSGIAGELDNQVDATVWALSDGRTTPAPAPDETLDALRSVFG